MAKSDKGDIQTKIDTAQTKSDTNTQGGIDDEQARLKKLADQKDVEHKQALEGYTGLSKTGGIDQSFVDYLNKPTFLGSGELGSSGGNPGSSSGGGGGGAPAAAGPSYLDVFNDLAGKSGGYDADRLKSIAGDTGYLRDSTGKYGDVDKAISGLGDIKYDDARNAIKSLGNINFDDTGRSIDDLRNIDYGRVTGSADKLRNIDQSGNQDTIQKLKDFASTGGVSQEDLARINRPMLEEFERTGGYSADDLANLRSRSNSAVPSFYQNLTNSINRGAVGSIRNPNAVNATTGNLARQSAQGTANAARDTELGISDTVRAGRMDASKTLAGNNLTLQGIKGQNTLGGYGAAGTLGLGVTGQQAANEASAGNLDLGVTGQKSANAQAAGQLGLGRATAQGNIASAQGQLGLGITGQMGENLGRQGTLGLTKQQQIDQSRAQAAGIDIGLQSDINKARMGGAGGLQTEALTRASIGASSGAAAAARNDANARFTAQLDAENQRFLAGAKQQGYETGISGIRGLSNDSTQDTQFNQSLLRGYGQDQAGNDLGLINAGINNNATNKSNVMGNISSLAGIGSGILPFLGGGPGGDNGYSSVSGDFGVVGGSQGTQPHIPGTPGSPTVNNAFTGQSPTVYGSGPSSFLSTDPYARSLTLGSFANG